jgi:hypothetical protein
MYRRPQEVTGETWHEKTTRKEYRYAIRNQNI